MDINNEQIKSLKKQIISQIESTFPEDKKISAIKQVEEMNDEQFLEFLKKNKLIDSSDETNESQPNIQNENPFRLIIEKKIPSYLIEENKDSIAVLEINPISKAHTIIIPKKPIKDSEKIPSSLFTLAKKVSKRITSYFKPKETIISSSVILGETIVQVLPVYDKESLTSKRNPASKEELEELQKIIEKKSKPKKIKKAKISKIKEQKILIPKRIP
ncbi:MAG TPA: HIT domain-containing protein [Candidatus Pacearchaeota archaeon]|nr:HIT domain-containing protein [Candidatus Pacearchaeota archaeon]